MTLEQANEIIEYFNKIVLPQLPKKLVEHLVPVPFESQLLVDYMHDLWVEKYDESKFDITKYDLTVGVYYYEKNDPRIFNAPLSEKWLNHHNIYNFPQHFIEILGQSQSSKSE